MKTGDTLKPLSIGKHSMLLVVAFLLNVAAFNVSAVAADIKVISVGTVTPVLHEVIPQYERQSGNKVQVSYGNPAVTLERLAKGDSADVVLVAGALWEQAEKTGRLKAETRTVLFLLAPRWRPALACSGRLRARGADLVRRRALSRISFLGIPDRPGAARWCGRRGRRRYGDVADKMAKPAARQGADRARSRPAGKGPALACSGRLRARGAGTWCGVEHCRGFPFWEFRIALVPPAGAVGGPAQVRGRRRQDGQTRSTARGRSSSLAPRWKSPR